MKNRFFQKVWSQWQSSLCEAIDIACPSKNLCQRTREAVTGQIENDVWTNTLSHTPKKLSHRCKSPSHIDVSKHFDVDNYVRSRFFFAEPSLMKCHSWMTECVCHIARETVLVSSAKRFDFDRLKIPPDVKLSSCISGENVCRIASKRKRASAVVNLSANVNNAKPLQPNAFLAPGLCQIRANTHKQNWLLQPNIWMQHADAILGKNTMRLTLSNVSWSKPKYPIHIYVYCQIRADHHYWL